MNVASTSGIRSAMAKPASVSCVLTASMIVARPIDTCPSSMVTASPLPVRAATTWECACRFACTQASSNASDWTNSRILSDTKSRIPDASGPMAAWSVAAAGAGSPCWLTAETSASVAASMSR